MNGGAFGENFPYNNFHDLNMDWIIKITKDFLDQYTHIQEVITNGEQSLLNLTADGLEQLQTKADALEALLQQWYDTHSQDIANQLADALSDLNQYLTDSINAFNRAADQKAQQTISTIPEDYTTLFNQVINLKSALEYDCIMMCQAFQNGPMIQSVEKNNYAATVTFTSNDKYFFYKTKDGKLAIKSYSMSGSYELTNTQGLIIDLDTGEITKSYFNTTPYIYSTGSKIVLMVCYYGFLVSPISTLNNELMLNQRGFNINSMIWENREVDVVSNPAYNVIGSVTKSGYSLTVVFNQQIVSAIFTDCNNDLGYYNITFTESNNSYTLTNTQALIYDITSHAFSIVTYKTQGSVANVKKSQIVLLVNWLGNLYSPIPSINEEIHLKWHAKREQYTGITVASYGARTIKNLQKGTGLVRTVMLYQGYHTICYRDNKTGKIEYYNLSIASGSDSYELANTQALVFNITTHELTTKYYTTQGSGTDIDDNCIVMFVNLFGIIYSPINSVQTELSACQQYPNKGTTITVEPDDDEFCQIRTIINGITDASEVNPYTLFIKNGVYEEIDIVTKDYVNLVGESIDGVVLYCDGTSTKDSPDDYHHEGDGGKPINTISKAWRHLMFHCSNSKVSNMTLKAKSTKYVIHQDAFSNPYTAIVENCNIIRDDVYNSSETDYDKGLQNIVGVGSTASQFQVYKKCNFINRLTGIPAGEATPADERCAMFWHNWNNRNASCGATLEECNVFNCNILKASELGSDQQDIINIINTRCDNPKFGIIYDCTPGYYVIDGQATSDPSLIPYCIKVNIVGCTPNYAVVSKIRQDGIADILNAFTIETSETTVQIKAGQPVKKTNRYDNVLEIADTEPFDVSMQTGNSGFIYVNTGSCFYGLFEAGTYAKYSPVYINNGYFTTTANGDVVGYINEDVTLSAEGLVFVIKN